MVRWIELQRTKLKKIKFENSKNWNWNIINFNSNWTTQNRITLILAQNLNLKGKTRKLNQNSGPPLLSLFFSLNLKTSPLPLINCFIYSSITSWLMMGMLNGRQWNNECWWVKEEREKNAMALWGKMKSPILCSALRLFSSPPECLKPSLCWC